jgi:hypothetical protein
MKFNEFTLRTDMLAQVAAFSPLRDMESLNVANRMTHRHLQQVLNADRHVNQLTAARDVVVNGVKIRYPTWEEKNEKFLQDQERLLAMYRGNMLNRKAPIYVGGDDDDEAMHQ